MIFEGDTMRTIVQKILWVIKIIAISIKTNSLFNFDLFLALVVSEWLKFKKANGSYPAKIDDIIAGKSFRDIEQSFHDDVDFVVKTLSNYYEKIHTSDFESINESDVYKALDIIKRYFFYLWI